MKTCFHCPLSWLWEEFDYVMWFIDLIGRGLEMDGSSNHLPWFFGKCVPIYKQCQWLFRWFSVTNHLAVRWGSPVCDLMRLPKCQCLCNIFPLVLTLIQSLYAHICSALGSQLHESSLWFWFWFWFSVVTFLIRSQHKGLRLQLQFELLSLIAAFWLVEGSSCSSFICGGSGSSWSRLEFLSWLQWESPPPHWHVTMELLMVKKNMQTWEKICTSIYW